MPPFNFLKSTPSGCSLSIKVQPRATRNEVVGPQGDSLKIKIAAPPVDSAANDELLRFLSDTLNCPKSALELVRGRTSRQKVVAVHGLCAEDASRLLANG